MIHDLLANILCGVIIGGTVYIFILLLWVIIEVFL